MNKKLLSLIAVVSLGLAGSTLKAQSFEEGTNIVSVGYGFGNFTKSLVKLAAGQDPSVKISAIGPVFAKFEHGMTDKIGLGLNIAYIGVKATDTYQSIDNNGNDVTYTDKIAYSSMSVLGRVNFHFANGDKIDPYFGIGVGYRTGGWKFTSTDPLYTEPTNLKGGGIGFETTLGMRYYVTDNIGLYAEIGIAKAPVQVGLAFKF